MHYIKNNLFIEKADVQNVAKKYGTPAYCYSLKKIKENIKFFKKNFHFLL